MHGRKVSPRVIAGFILTFAAGGLPSPAVGGFIGAGLGILIACIPPGPPNHGVGDATTKEETA